MLRTYIRKNDHLAYRDMAVTANASMQEVEGVVWFDLINPTPEEDHFLEQIFSVSIPTRAEMNEIEPSARLYIEDSAKFMTITAVTKISTDAAEKTPITFVLKDNLLITVRYEETSPFINFALRSQKANSINCSTGEQVMLGIIEAIIDRISDALERVGSEVDTISRDVFRNKTSTATKKTRDLQGMIEQIGLKGDLLAMVRESLVSINRLITYYAMEPSGRKAAKASIQKGDVLQRDAVSLSDHATFLSNKINFLLDAILGLINLEQNQIIKIFSVAAVVFLPPTLVASVYGMNFTFIPELKWAFGYPWAIGLMLLSAILPFFYFRKKGWL